MQMNEAFECHDTEHLRYWHPLDSTVAYAGNAGASFRTTDSFDGARDALRSSNMSDRLISSPAEHARCHISPRAVNGTNADVCATSSDARLWWNFEDTEHYACNYRNVPVCSRPTDCHRCGCAGVQSCDKLHSISVDKLRTAKPEFPAAENVTSCSRGDELFPVLHSARSASSCVAGNSTTECCDVNSVRTGKLRYRSHAARQQNVFTNCQTTDFNSYGVNHEQYQSAPHVRQSTSMNELDDFDLPLHDTSSVNSSLIDEMVRNNTSATAQSSFSPDGCVASGKPDIVSSRLQKEDQGRHNVDDPELIWHTAANVRENRSELNVLNCVEADASMRSPSFCSKLPSSGRKSKKKVQRPGNERLQSVVAQKIVSQYCQNLPAYRGAIENNLCTSASEYVHRTDLNAESEELNDSDLPVHDASSVNSSSLDEMVRNNVSAAAQDSFSRDVGYVASGKSDSASSRLRNEDRGKQSDVVDRAVAANVNVKNALHEEKRKSEDVDAAGCSAAQHTEPSITEPVQADKPSHFCVDSRAKVETVSGVRHHRRPPRKTPRAAPRQKSARHGDSEQYRATTNFHLQQFLESVDWQQLHQNFGLFFIMFSSVLSFFFLTDRKGNLAQFGVIYS